MTSRTNGSATTSYTYNAFGNLKTANLADGTDIEYALDPFGRRVARHKDGAVTERYLYGPEAITPVAQVDAQGNAIARFVYATSNHSPDYIVKSGNTYRIVTDQLGSVRLVVDSATGTVAQRISYDEFGRVTSDSNPGFQPFGFAGGLYDKDTGLVHFGDREYDPKLGRFTSVDPIGFAGGQLNMHAYVMGDPVNIVDPTGLDWVNDLGQGAMCFGDAVTFGISGKVRDLLGMGNVKDECSSACGAGELGAAALPWPGGKGKLLLRYGDDFVRGGRFGHNPRSLDFSPGTLNFRTPSSGKPGTSDVYDYGRGKGTIRDFGPNGRAKTDYDFGHDHGVGDPHAHDWDWTKAPPRQPGRSLRDGE